MTIRPRARDALRSRPPTPTSLIRPICGVLTTMAADGQPQSSLVWVDLDGECARVNTTLERQKGRNLLANPKVSLLVVDPDNTGRFIQIRGDVELVTNGALDHLDALTREVHPPCPLLRRDLSRRAAGARDAGHLPHPRPADDPRRDPRLRFAVSVRPRAPPSPSPRTWPWSAESFRIRPPPKSVGGWTMLPRLSACLHWLSMSEFCWVGSPLPRSAVDAGPELSTSGWSKSGVPDQTTGILA